jgi:hypothetical protein
MVFLLFITLQITEALLAVGRPLWGGNVLPTRRRVGLPARAG